jgi:hypothetical protein
LGNVERDYVFGWPLKAIYENEYLAKLKCLLQRRHSFDLYDLVYAAFFERLIEADRALVLSTILKKTIFERSPGSAEQILLGLPANRAPLFNLEKSARP